LPTVAPDKRSSRLSRASDESEIPAVTIVAHDVGPVGGMELQLSHLINGLLSRGMAVTVIARRCDLQPQPQLQWIRVPGPSRPFPIAYPFFFILGSLKVWQHRRGLLHTTGAIVSNHTDLCTIHHCHHGSGRRAQLAMRSGNRIRRLNRRIGRAMSLLAERWLYQPAKVRRFVAVSSGVASEMATHFPRISTRIKVIPNAVDPEVFRPDAAARRNVRRRFGIEDEAFVAIFIGGDWVLKGLGVALGAIAQSQTSHLMVVGSGDLVRFQVLARRAGCADRIHFAGRQSRTAEFYASADVLVLPTIYETFSLVAYEAAASGLPLLVSRVSGVEDILRAGENGWFIRRDATEIATRLRMLETDVSMRRRMGARSRELATPYTWSRVIDGYVAVYAELIRGNGQAVEGPSPAGYPIT
jgi:glycosyltransferase involved in cell wall biosynthesis